MNAKSNMMLVAGGASAVALVGMIFLSGEAHINGKDSLVASMMQVGAEEVPTELVIIEEDVYSGRTPKYRIVENGECIGLQFTDGSVDGACYRENDSLPTVTYNDVFPLEAHMSGD